MLDVMTDLPRNVVAFRASGEVTTEDYKDVVIPEIEDRLRDQDKLHLLYYTEPDFEGFSPGAMWQDSKLGFRHRQHWDKVAVVTDRQWLSNATRLLRFTIPGEVRVFAQHELPTALQWVETGEA